MLRLTKAILTNTISPKPPNSPVKKGRKIHMWFHEKNQLRDMTCPTLKLVNGETKN